MMNPQQLQKLANDILENGLREPIVLTPDGKTLVDGRNRLRACGVAGVEPRFKKLPKNSAEEDVLRYIVIMKLKGGGLSTSQRGLVGAFYADEMKKARRVEAQFFVRSHGRFVSPETPQVRKSNPLRKQAAQLVGTGDTTIQDCIRVMKEAPDLISRIESGEISVKMARTIMLERIAPKPKPVRKAPSKAGSPPSPSDKTREGILSRVDWLRYYAQEEKLPSYIIAKRLGILDSRVRQIAKRYEIEIPDDQWMLKRRKLSYDVNRVAQVIADDLVAMEDSIARLRENVSEIDDPSSDDWMRIYWRVAKQLNGLAKALYDDKNPTMKRTNDDNDNAS